MDQKERDTQRALGNMEEFRVTIMVPIKVNVRMTQNVEAVNEEDAIEKVKIIHDIIPDNKLLQDVVSNVKNIVGNKAKFDTSVDREYKVQQLHKLKSLGEVLTSSGDSCSGCESSG